MAYTNLSDLFTGICDAIRAKKGTTGSINHQDIPSEISSIAASSGGGYVGSDQFVETSLSASSLTISIPTSKLIGIYIAFDLGEQLWTQEFIDVEKDVICSAFIDVSNLSGYTTSVYFDNGEYFMVSGMNFINVSVTANSVTLSIPNSLMCFPHYWANGYTYLPIYSS